ncbi:MAG: electron transfer flavoprotein subunit alpha/FixB family protein [Deltaproteobacteria bacterium]|nr:electron transfer flavoprotein subunit alpha/FixB family protein [Deltaproteobacteria bacterium]
MSNQRSIVILAEHDRGEFRPTTWEGLTLAREIKAHGGGLIRIVILGDPVKGPAEKLAGQAGEEVLALRTAGLPGYHPEVTLEVLADHFGNQTPAYLIIPHSSRSWELAPRLAHRLGLTCLTGVTRVVGEEDRIRFQKPLYGGKINVLVEPWTSGAVLTFEPGYFKGEDVPSGRPGSCEFKTVSRPSSFSELLETIPPRETGADLRAAETIVAAGRGIGRPDNLELIRSLAGLFPRSSVAGSRPLCDLGWLKYNQQVGLTGTTVAPRLYLACGISGAYQHVAGMKDSGFIVSINRDPRAAMVNWSDLVIVEDLETFLPLLIETIQNVRKKSAADLSK